MLQAALKREIIVDRTLCRVSGVLVFAVLTALGAFVRIPLPFTPVPLTLQTFFVLLSGAFLGARLGSVAQVSYILLGIMGLPVFTGAGSGILYLSGPTTGYLFGFVLSALLVGRFIKYAKDSLLLTLIAFSIADIVLLACGAIWIKFLFGYSLSQSMLIGFIPFIPGDLLKISAAAFLYLRLKPRIKEVF